MLRRGGVFGVCGVVVEPEVVGELQGGRARCGHGWRAAPTNAPLLGGAQHVPGGLVLVVVHAVLAPKDDELAAGADVNGLDVRVGDAGEVLAAVLAVQDLNVRAAVVAGEVKEEEVVLRARGGREGARPLG